MDNTTTIYREMSNHELTQVDREINDRAKVYVDKFNATPDLIPSYREFFSQPDIDNILISGFNYQELVNNNASNDKYNYFMKCLVKYMVKVGLLESLNLSNYIMSGNFGSVYSNTIFPAESGESVIKNLFVTKANKRRTEDINREVLAGYVLNTLKGLVPNFSYQYGVKDCVEYNPNWCNDTTRLSIMQFANGIPMYDFLKGVNIHASPKSNGSKIKKGILSGNLYDPVFNNDDGDINDSKEDDAFYQKDLDCIVLQLFNALNVAHTMHGFVHHDLHGYNILIQKLPNPILIPIYTEQIQFKGTTIKDTPFFYIKTRYIPIMLDYGISYYEFQGQQFMNVTLDKTTNLLYSRKYPTSDIYSILILLSYFDERYRVMKNILFKDVNISRHDIRNDYLYEYREVLDLIIKICVYNAEGDRHNGAIANEGSSAIPYNHDSFIDPNDYLRDNKDVTTLVQKCAMDKLHLATDEREYSTEREEHIIDLLTTLVNSYNNSKVSEKKILRRLLTFTQVDGIKIEKLIASLDMMCYDFTKAKWIYQFIDSLHNDLVNTGIYSDRTGEIYRLREFMRKKTR